MMLDIYIGLASAVICITLAGALDFLRGNRWPIGWGAVKKLLLGILLAYASGLTGYGLILGSVLWALSYANGWGTPLGASLAKARGEDVKMGPGYEGWQSLLGKVMPKVLTDPILAMEMRGVLAFMFVLPLMYFSLAYLALLPVLMFAYSASAKISYKLSIFGIHHWKRYEVVRGVIVGLGCVVVSYCPA